MENLVCFLQFLQASFVLRYDTRLMSVAQGGACPEELSDDDEPPTALFLPSPTDDAPGYHSGFGSQEYDFSDHGFLDLDYVDMLPDTPALTTTTTTVSSVSDFDRNTELNAVSEATNSPDLKTTEFDDLFDELEAFLNSSSVEIV